jgi:hypothetical protein
VGRIIAKGSAISRHHLAHPAKCVAPLRLNCTGFTAHGLSADLVTEWCSPGFRSRSRLWLLM